MYVRMGLTRCMEEGMEAYVIQVGLRRGGLNAVAHVGARDGVGPICRVSARLYTQKG